MPVSCLTHTRFATFSPLLMRHLNASREIVKIFTSPESPQYHTESAFCEPLFSTQTCPQPTTLTVDNLTIRAHPS